MNKLQVEKDLVMKAIKNNAFYLAFASEGLRSDKEVVMAAINSDIGESESYGRILYPVSETLKFASVELKADKEVVMAAISNNGAALEYASEELKADKEVLRTAISNNGAALKYAEELKADKELVMAAVNNNGASLSYAAVELKSDEEVVIAAINKNGLALEFASKELKANKKVVMAAVKNNGASLRYADDKLKADKEVVMAAVSSNGASLRYAADELKFLKEFILIAVSNYDGALYSASEELKADKDVVLAAVNNNGTALEYASEKLKADKEVVMAAISNNGAALEYAAEKFKANKEIVIKSFNNKLFHSGTFFSIWKLAKKLFLQKPTIFEIDDVFVIHSIKTKGGNGFWVKCETWNFDGEDVYVFNRPNCFGTLESDDGDYTGLNEVILTCKKFKSISDALQYENPPDSDDLGLDDSEKIIFNYDDVLNNNFMIIGEYILHQKFASKILGELNPWSYYSKSMNIDIYNVFEDGDSTDAKKLGFEIKKIPFGAISEGDLDSEAELYINSSGEKYLKPDFGEDVYDEEENQRDVTFRWYGRVEGSMYINMDYGSLNYEHSGVSLDYVQVIDKL
jgi:CxxC motif-containing protein